LGHAFGVRRVGLSRSSGVLAVVYAQFEVDWARPERIEDELIRSGARDAHMLADDVPIVAVTVSARSLREANALVRDLLEHVGAGSVEIIAPRVLLGSLSTFASRDL
jgi:hypothetical protein